MAPVMKEMNRNQHIKKYRRNKKEQYSNKFICKEPLQRHKVKRESNNISENGHVKKLDMGTKKSSFLDKTFLPESKKKKSPKKEKENLRKTETKREKDKEENEECERPLLSSKFLRGDHDSDGDADFENFLKENNIEISSSEEEEEDGCAKELFLEKNEGKVDEKNRKGKLKDGIITVEYVMKSFNSINENLRISKILKILALYKDAMDHFIVQTSTGEMPVKNAEQNENKKKNKKEKHESTKDNTLMNTDTALFIIFNVLYNIDTFFYNLMNKTSVQMKIWSVESIKEKKIFEEKEKDDSENEKKEKAENSTKKRDTTDEICKKNAKIDKHPSKYDIINIEKNPNFKKYKLLIVTFFNSFLKKLKNIGENELSDGIFKLLKKICVLRWLIPTRFGVYFAKKVANRFIISEKNETYFLLFVIIRNILFLYNEKKEEISSSQVDIEDRAKEIYMCDKDIFTVYQYTFRLYLFHYGKRYTVTNLRHINFKENCLSELFTHLSDDVKYFFAFRYIQVIIQKIREEYKILYIDQTKNSKKIGNNKENFDNQKKKNKKNTGNANVSLLSSNQFHVHSIYMILLLRFLTKMLASCESLNMLSYGVTTLIIAILKMKLNVIKYIPFHLQLLNMLIRLIENKKKYIPLFSYFTCILNGLQKYSSNKNYSKKEFNAKDIERFDINMSLEVNETIITDFTIQHQIFDKIYILLYDFIGLMAQSVSFPEFFVFIDTYLKKYCDNCKVAYFRTNLKNLLTNAKHSIEIITKERKNINIYSVDETITYFENKDLPILKERLRILKNYENMYLKKIEATLHGLQSIKYTYNDETDKRVRPILGTSEEKKDMRKKYKKETKRKHENICEGSTKMNEYGNVEKKIKKNNFVTLPEKDCLEEFSMSSDNEI